MTRRAGDDRHAGRYGRAFGAINYRKLITSAAMAVLMIRTRSGANNGECSKGNCVPDALAAAPSGASSSRLCPG
jgi:hypothetical protein